MKLEMGLGRRKLTPQQERLWRLLEFMIRVNLLALPLYAILWIGIDFYPIQLVVATQAGLILQAMGYQVIQDGIGLLVGGSFQFFIIPDCTGWKSMLFLFALIFAVPRIATRKRVIGLLIGLPIMWLGNTGRVIAVVAAQAAWGTELAMVLHDWLFQLGLVGLVLGAWIVWLNWAKGRSSIKSIFLRRK
jgi:exosortase/archaeosortase family protein